MEIPGVFYNIYDDSQPIISPLFRIHRFFSASIRPVL